MDDAELTCELRVTPTAAGDIGLAFDVRNPGAEAVTVRYFRPFTGFELAVEAEDGPVAVIQPAYDTPVRPHSATIAPGAGIHIDTPIHLRFDPDAPPSGGDAPTRWSLAHAPAPVRLRATLQLMGVAVAPCEARFDPHAAR